MGSFNATCIISNLPIEAGTPVRFLALTASKYHADGNEHICYVAGRWQLRCAPLRAQYNDYGSVEHIKKRLVNRVFIESLNRDCVEKGVGDNQCHDVQVRPGMTIKQWLEALWEGRVYVTDHQPRGRAKKESADAALDDVLDLARREAATTRYEPPPGMPSLSRIEKVLQNNKLPVVTEYGAEGYVLDEVSTGFIRVRHGRYGDSAEHEKALQPLIPLLDAAGYAAMITCGTGMYNNPAEILVAPKPVPKGAKDENGKDIYFHSAGLGPDEMAEKHGKPRPVSQAMIREDVWQILLKTPIDHWRGSFTFDDMQRDANAVLDAEIAWKEEEKAFLARDPKTIRESERVAWMSKAFRRSMDSREDMENHFRAAIYPHEGVSGFSLRQAFEMGMELAESREELEGFITDMAETAYVQWQYAHLHGQWHPTTNSGQDGNWKAHRAFLKALAKIKGRWEDE